MPLVGVTDMPVQPTNSCFLPRRPTISSMNAFHLVDAIKPLIESGRLRAYSINSVNKYSFAHEKNAATT